MLSFLLYTLILFQSNGLARVSSNIASFNPRGPVENLRFHDPRPLRARGPVRRVPNLSGAALKEKTIPNIIGLSTHRQKTRKVTPRPIGALVPQATKAAERVEQFAKRNFDLPRESVIKAVESSGGRVTASDIAGSAGVSVSEAKRNLNLIASLTNGALEVSKDGDIVYELGTGVRGALASRSLGLKARDAFQAVWPVLFYLTKISFGLAIFVSIAVIYSAIGVISSSSSNSRDDRRGGGYRDNGYGGYRDYGYNSGPNVFVNFGGFGNPFNAFYYRPYGYYAPYGRGEGMGFLESVFSYVFGDGDPNAERKQKSIRAAARIIRDSFGVVTAEQLAPVLSPNKAPKQSGNAEIDDENFMLDVLVALNGSPEVTETGDIVYVFPDLSITAAVAEYEGDMGQGRDDDEVQYYGSTAIYPEKEIPFSLAPGFNKVVAGGLGIINLLGAIYLGALLRDPYLIYKVGPQFAYSIKGLFPFLLTYAVGFNAIPLVRSFVNKAKNADIEARNYFRALWANRQRSPEVQRKIRSAQKYRPKRKVVSRDQIEYTSGKDLDEQGYYEDERKKFRDFDERVNKPRVSKEQITRSKLRSSIKDRV